MALIDLLQSLRKEKSNPCVTISLNTHRTHPDNAQDTINLKDLLKEAEKRVLDEFQKRDVTSLLEKIATIQGEIDVNHNLDSLHIFLSNDTQEYVRSPWPASHNRVNVSESFAVRPLIKQMNRSEPYLIMSLSQKSIHLFEAINDGIVQEIKNEDFPYKDNIPTIFYATKLNDPKYVDDLVKNFYNKVDKSLVKVHKETGLNCVVVCTTDNYSFLQKVADKPDAYLGYVPIDYNNSAPHQIVKQTWAFIEDIQKKNRTKDIDVMKEAVAKGTVLTDLQEIYQAAIDGNADLLIVHQDFVQPVLMKDERTFDLIEDTNTPNAIDDITSNIAWEVILRKGKVIFTGQEELEDLGKIVLKTRY